MAVVLVFCGRHLVIHQPEPYQPHPCPFFSKPEVVEPAAICVAEQAGLANTIRKASLRNVVCLQQQFCELVWCERNFRRDSTLYLHKEFELFLKYCLVFRTVRAATLLPTLTASMCHSVSLSAP